jgi:hypothetical protein
MEWEGIYNYIIIAIIACFIIAIICVFVIKPAMDKGYEQQIFEQQRDAFLARFCKNLGYEAYKLENIEGTPYNMICYSNIGQNARTFSYHRFEWERKDGEYQFFVLQERK